MFSHQRHDVHSKQNSKKLSQTTMSSQKVQGMNHREEQTEAPLARQENKTLSLLAQTNSGRELSRSSSSREQLKIQANRLTHSWELVWKSKLCSPISTGTVNRVTLCNGQKNCLQFSFIDWIEFLPLADILLWVPPSSKCGTVLSTDRAVQPFGSTELGLTPGQACSSYRTESTHVWSFALVLESCAPSSTDSCLSAPNELMQVAMAHQRGMVEWLFTMHVPAKDGSGCFQLNPAKSVYLKGYSTERWTNVHL